MKISSINNSNQSFKGANLGKITNVFSKVANSAVNVMEKHPIVTAGLAGSSVIAQKIVMSGSEAVIGPVMDVGIGKVITKASKETDGRTNDSSKKQAIRTFSQSVGGTITGVIIRGLCIAASTACALKALTKSGSKAIEAIEPALRENTYILSKSASSKGKAIGGAVAIGIMMFTNFLIDVPLINAINKGVTKLIYKTPSEKKEAVNE